jgi:hypothetical protein
MHAKWHGDSDVVRQLLKRNEVDVNTRPNAFFTPLWWCRNAKARQNEHKHWS